MADTILGKEAEGYGYKYTDIAGIHKWLESKGLRYYQYVETDEQGNDYVYTVPVTIDGKEHEPRRGCRIVMATLNGKSNPAQEQGSAITYARRYSLLMAFGLATTDDDAACMSVPKVEGEVVEETPKDKKNQVKGYPSRKIMMEVIKKRFPEGSKLLDDLLSLNNLQSLDEMTDAQMSTVYNKIGGR